MIKCLTGQWRIITFATVKRTAITAVGGWGKHSLNGLKISLSYKITSEKQWSLVSLISVLEVTVEEVEY